MNSLQGQDAGIFSLKDFGSKEDLKKHLEKYNYPEKEIKEILKRYEKIMTKKQKET